MSDIQDEAYTELCAENERLKNEILELGHRVKLSKYQELQALLTRAADALEKVASYASGDPDSYRVLRIPEQQLIEELRKAAQ
jgi:hypothetical protein